MHDRQEAVMPEKKTLERARKDKRQGKAPSTQAGEFVREEMEHIRRGKHGARSAKQAVAIGLSKARRAGVELQPPTSEQPAPKKRQSRSQQGERKAAPRAKSTPRASKTTTARRSK